MSTEDAYHPLGEVGKRLEKACLDLENGRLNVEEMDGLLADIRSLEQRVIVLQYKAMENMARGLTPSGQKVPDHGTLSFSFGIPETSEEPENAEELSLEDRNQISLIDSIEELSAAEQAEQRRLRKARAEEEKKRQVSIELVDEKEKKEQKITSPKKEKETPVASKKEVQPEELKAAEPSPKIEIKGRKDEPTKKKKSINEEEGTKKAPTLAQKLGSKPIESIQKALSVNARLGVVKTLFKGDSEAATAFVQNLDASAGEVAAKVLLDQESAAREWQETSQPYKKLVSLIARRFSE